MGNKPNMKEVEVSIPDVYSGPKRGAVERPAPSGSYYGSPGGGAGYYSSKVPEVRSVYIGNLPWDATEDEVMRTVCNHARGISCRIDPSDDPDVRGMYAVVTMESYIDVLKCINSLHGIRYEGRVLDVKKMKF